MSRRIAALLLLIVIAYGVFKAMPLIRGPQIQISSFTTDESGLTILSGRAIHTETLSMDGGTLLIDEDGAFSTKLTLPHGGAILTMTATDRFGRSRTLQRPVITP